MSSDGLVLRGVTTGFDAGPVITDVDLTVAPGEVVALLGPSGCGKTTVLRCIAGLQPLWDGSISWMGTDWAGTPTHARRVGLMFQHHALFPHRNVGENVGFGLRMQRVAAAARAARVDELLDLVGLGGFEHRTIDTLSGGEAQRVALARALAPNPQVLLLDEPLGSLDRGRRDQLVGEIRRVVRALGITTVHVTHDQDEAATIADRIALLRDGRIVATGSYDELVDHPPDATTAAFLGVETVWTLVADERGQVATPLGRLATGAPPGSSVVVLLRPQHVQVTPDLGSDVSGQAIADRRSGVPGEVIACRRTAQGWLIRCRTGAAGQVAAITRRRLGEGSAVLVDPVALDHAEILNR